MMPAHDTDHDDHLCDHVVRCDAIPADIRVREADLWLIEES